MINGKSPKAIAEFFRGRRIVVAGVSRNGGQAAKTVYHKLKDCG